MTTNLSYDDIIRVALVDEKFASSRDIIHVQISGLRDYLQIFDVTYSSAAEQEGRALTDLLSTMSKPQRDYYMTWEYDDRWHDTLTSQFYGSYVIWACSVFEVILSSLRRDIAIIDNDSNVVADKSRGKLAFKQYKAFLVEKFGELPPNEHTWKRIDDVYIVRNTLVHNGGWVPGTKCEEHVRNYIVRHAKGIGIEYERLTIRSDYCKSIVDLFAEFCDDAFESIGQLCEQAASQPDFPSI